MKLLLTLTFITLLALPVKGYSNEVNIGYKGNDNISYDISRHSFTVHGITIDFKDRVLILDHVDYSGEIIEFTPDHELFINDSKVPLTPDQQVLVKDFYNEMRFVFKETKSIGVEGAKIGLHGAQIGLSAIGGLFKMLLTNYNEDDFERDMERRSSKIERRAKRLERRANKLDDAVENVTHLSVEMYQQIPALQKVEWLSD